MEESKKKVIVTLVISMLIFGYSLYDFVNKTGALDEPEPVIQAVNNREILAASEYIVYVSGAVNKPGVFKTSSESRVFDIINAAGGVTSRADVEKVNMAQLVKDGMHVNIPTKIKPLPPTGSVEMTEGTTVLNSSNNSASMLININTASKSDLEKLPGIGPALAQRIMDYRSSSGPFSEIEDIRNVSGIGQAKFNQIKDKISI